jgi:hypothetical protein
MIVVLNAIKQAEKRKAKPTEGKALRLGPSYHCADFHILILSVHYRRLNGFRAIYSIKGISCKG